MNLCKESLKIQACWDSNPELCDTSVGLEQTTFFLLWPLLEKKNQLCDKFKDHDYNTGKTSFTTSIPLTYINSSCLTLLAEQQLILFGGHELDVQKVRNVLFCLT